MKVLGWVSYGSPRAVTVPMALVQDPLPSQTWLRCSLRSASYRGKVISKYSNELST